MNTIKNKNDLLILEYLENSDPDKWIPQKEIQDSLDFSKQLISKRIKILTEKNLILKIEKPEGRFNFKFLKINLDVDINVSQQSTVNSQQSTKIISQQSTVNSQQSTVNSQQKLDPIIPEHSKKLKEIYTSQQSLVVEKRISPCWEELVEFVKIFGKMKEASSTIQAMEKQITKYHKEKTYFAVFEAYTLLSQNKEAINEYNKAKELE